MMLKTYRNIGLLVKFMKFIAVLTSHSEIEAEERR